jgi:hypothetical protein
MKITVDMSMLDLKGHANKVMNYKAFWTFAASEWHRLYSPYVPSGDSGNLRDQVVIRPGEIEHTVPYAHYQYQGIVYGPNYPISEGGRVTGYFSPPHKRPTGAKLKYRNPKASAKWDQAAAGTQMPNLVASLQAYIDSGRIKLD